MPIAQLSEFNNAHTLTMKNKTIVLCFIAVLFGLSMLVAQKPCNNFDCKIALARQALNAKPPQYQKALDLARGAESYDPKRKAEVYDFIGVVFNAIEKKRIDAETQKELAQQATKKAKEAEAKAKKALVDVQTAYNTNARQKLELARKYEKENRYVEASETAQFAWNIATEKTLRDSIVVALLRLSNLYIYNIQYNEAFNNLEFLKNNQVITDSFRLLTLEIAYWYTQADTLEAAIKTLKLLNINALPNRNDLLTVIQKNTPTQYFTLLEERYYPKMIKVEGGTFTMGSNSGKDDEKPPHSVKVNSFWIAETETTVWQYFLYLKAKRQKPYGTPTWQYSVDNPMIYVSWNDAQDYLKWVNEQRKGGIYKLPTEAEWEFAARGGNLVQDKTLKYSGSNDIDKVAWYTSNSSSRMQPVKRLQRNALGLYDMSGNVYEWCQDNYNKTFYADCAKQGTVENPLYEKTYNDIRVVRGGSWYDYDSFCRVSDRGGNSVHTLSLTIGFRCVRYD